MRFVSTYGAFLHNRLPGKQRGRSVGKTATHRRSLQHMATLAAQESQSSSAAKVDQRAQRSPLRKQAKALTVAPPKLRRRYE